MKGYSGTAVLHLAVLAVDVYPDTTTITTPITFVASANAGLYTGAHVALADTDSEKINIPPEVLAKAIKANPNTKPIIPVHFVELPCEMDQMKLMADQAGIASIENVAHAHGAVYPNIGHIGSCT